MIKWYDETFFKNCLKPIKDQIGIQNVFTPIANIEKATGVSFVNLINDNCSEICVLFNVEFIIYFLNSDYIKNKNIKLIFCYDSEVDKNIAINVFNECKYNNYELIDLIEFSESKNVKDIVKAMGQRKFDFIFSNPPYNHNIDLKILQQMFDCAKHIVFVHPAGYLFDKKFDTNLYNEIRNTNYLEYVNFFFGNTLFDIGLFLPICISVWNMNKVGNTCKIIDNAFWNETYISIINDISFHKRSMQNEIDILKNTVNKYNHLVNYRVDIPKTDWNIFISPIKGNQPRTSRPMNEFTHLVYDFFTIATKDITKSIVAKNFRFKKTFSASQRFLWSFDTQNERDNCLNYFKTKVCRFLLTYRKIGQNLSTTMDLIPWLDFTQEWNDAKLCKEFNISKELWQYIDKFIPDYYDDYKSGFEN